MRDNVKSSAKVKVLQLDAQEVKHATVIAGVSPNVLRRVFVIWVLMVAAIAAVVSAAPDLTLFFVAMTIAVLLAFSVLIFSQSRISEGWPAIVYYHGKLGVVKDPIQREFIFVPLEVVVTALPHILTPNKKAVAIQLDESGLNDADKALLNQAIWPYDDKLVALSYFKKRENICKKIIELRNK